MSVLKKNNVRILGDGPKTMVFAHGYGCDQNVWRFITPAFSSQYRIVLFDHVGAGNSDLVQYSTRQYSSLQAYASDLLEILEELGIELAIYIGHSVSAMIGILAAIRAPERFDRLVLVGPSPCYINDGDYTGGFTRADIDELLEVLSANYLGWSSSMAPLIMNQPGQPELADELYNSFCRTDPQIARQFARVTFLGDNRADLRLLTRPALILQCSDDAIAPVAVGNYMHRQMPQSTLMRMEAAGHCPHMSAPQETIAAIRSFI
ncbi:alpha/beta fold hydrolase [Noviherbaspirillum soli]|uniref:alpha/beta fold hydrolase n=1 Tax=Noviherbaspirillum soli TaxID=1064518 RepID=UPI002B2781A9|nr:alpha/beta hydrolase [Noviherbaspirillum soli]